MQTITFTLNGDECTITADPDRSLLDVLRDDLGLTGAKKGCDRALCGACAVLVDGRVVMSCRFPVKRVEGKSVETVEGIGTPVRPHVIQRAFVAAGAVQCGYCTPGMVVRAKALLATDSAPTRDRIVTAFQPHLCRCTGYAKIIEAVELAAAVLRGETELPAAQPAPGESLIGCRIPRRDSLAKATGTEVYAADATPSGVLHLKVVRSPHAHAVLGGVDGAAALTQPGVVAVLTAADVAGTNRLKISRADTPVLCDEKVRFVGDPVAVVVAETEAQAAAAAESVVVAYEPLPAVFDARAALAEGAPQLHDDSPNLLSLLQVVRGDAPAALAAADVCVAGRFTTSPIEHAYLEPDAGTAFVDDDGVLVISAGSQNIYQDHKSLTEALGVAPDKLRVVQTPTGGAFGGKLDVSVQGVLGAAALKLGRPVKLVYTREETHLATTKRHGFEIEARLAAGADGRLTALEMHIVSDTGAYASFGKSVMTRALAHVSGPYVIPNVFVTGRVVFTNGPVGGAMRGFGVPQVLFAVESLMDELADSLGMDRLEIRRRNALGKGEVTCTGQLLDHEVGLVQCLDRLRPLYDDARRRAAASDSAHAAPGQDAVPARGVGLGCFWFGPGKSKPDESEAHAELLDDGTVRVHMAAADIGQGSDTVFAQIAAQELGLAFAAVDMVSTDTGSCPDGGYSSGSRQTYLSGGAVQTAAGALGAALIEAAAARLGVDSGDLYCAGGAVRSRRSDTPWVSFADLAATGFAGRRFAGRRVADITTVDAETGQGSPYETYSFGVQMAEVAVDPTTGETRVERVTAVHDSGTPINMLTLEGQIEGGIAQGVGYALLEKFVRDETLNFNTYRIPRVKDVPEVVTIMVEVPRPGGPHGAAAVAECALVPTAPAIVNAIADATGVRVRDLPVAKEGLLAR